MLYLQICVDWAKSFGKDFIHGARDKDTIVALLLTPVAPILLWYYPEKVEQWNNGIKSRKHIKKHRQ